MKALVKHEIIGQTSFGDPEILVTVLEPHPKAGLQLLLRSTASMDHMKAKSPIVSYLVYPYPEERHGRSLWNVAVRGKTLEVALAQLARHVDWAHWREVLSERVELGVAQNALSRFGEGLSESDWIDFESEWNRVLEEVARINLVVEQWREEFRKG